MTTQLTDTELFKNFQEFRVQLNNRFLERETIIDGLLASLLSQQNAFLFGVPGTGKSELVREISNGFKGTKYFGYLLSPTTDPSELFGPVAVTKLLKDEYTRDTEGYLPSSNICFLDELFRGSSAVLNSLLTILNERTFNNGKEVIETPIQSVVAATNSFPNEESLQAFLDRFLFRPTVNLLQKPVSKRMLDHWSLGLEPRPLIESKLTADDLLTLQKAAARTGPSKKFAEVFGEVMNRLDSAGVEVSDRRRVQLIKFLRGYAVVKGSDEITPSMLLDTLPHILYQTEDDKDAILECLHASIVTAEKIQKDISNAANSVMHTFYEWNSKKPNDLSAFNECARQVRKCHNDMNLIISKLRDTLDDEDLEITEQARLKLMKLYTQSEGDLNRITKALEHYTTN